MNPRSVSIYGHWICPFYTRVSFALAQRGIEHDVVDLPPSAVRGPDFDLPAEFVEHSPNLEIPMVRVDDKYLANSIPILEWLEEEIPQSPLLPQDSTERDLVRERSAWIDKHAFRPMVGVYYGFDPDRVETAAQNLHDALEEMGAWTVDTGWLAGPGPTLAEAVAIPIYVRMAGLRALGFHQPLPVAIAAHRDRCRALRGWPTVAWTDAQTNELLGRFRAYRRKMRAG